MFLKKGFRMPSLDKKPRGESRGRSLDMTNEDLRERLSKNNKAFLNRDNNETQHYKDIIPKVVNRNRSVSREKANRSVLLPSIHGRR